MVDQSVGIINYKQQHRPALYPSSVLSLTDLFMQPIVILDMIFSLVIVSRTMALYLTQSFMAFITLGRLIGSLPLKPLVLRDCGYHQAMEDDGNLVFCCGEYLSATPSSWDGSYSAQCGLFNPSGDTSPNYPYWTQYIGSLNDYIHDSYYTSPPFFLAGMRYYIDAVQADNNHWAGLYFSGCSNWFNADETFGSQYYYFL